MDIEEAKKVLKGLGSDELGEVLKSLGIKISEPDENTRNRLWKIAVWAFAIVMVGAFLFLAVGAFIAKPQNPIASGDVLISMFTAAVGFFAGLFAPSPGK